MAQTPRVPLTLPELSQCRMIIWSAKNRTTIGQIGRSLGDHRHFEFLSLQELKNLMQQCPVPFKEVASPLQDYRIFELTKD